MAAAALRALTLLGLIGASCALFIQEVIGDWLAPFVLANVMTLTNRRRLLAGMAAGALVAIVAGLIVLWRKDIRRLRRMSHLLTPAILLGLVPQLCVPAAWPDKTTVAIVIGGFLLLAERLFRIAFLAAAESPPGAPEVSDGLSAVVESCCCGRRLRRWLPPLVVVDERRSSFDLCLSRCLALRNSRALPGCPRLCDLGQYDDLLWN